MARPWARWACGVALALGGLTARAPAQSPPAVRTADTDTLPPPRRAEADPPAAQLPGANPDCPAVGITLVEALHIALLSNLDIAQARQVVRQAQAALQRAEVLWLPNVNSTLDYTFHDGRIQKTEGNIIKTNRDALLIATGPSLSLGLADAIFSYGVARQVRTAVQAGQRRVTNDTLLAVADAYFAVLRARRRVARLDEVLEFLTSDRPRELRGDLKGLLPLITDYVEAGQSSLAEKTRVEVEVLRRRNELVAALQDLRVADAELARLLHLDSTVVLWPLEDYRVPMAVPGDAWFGIDLVVLVETALNNRPELAENQALVQAALNRVRAACWRPLLPTLLVTYSDGGFGGAPPLLLGPGIGFGRSGAIGNFGNRDDFEGALLWQFRNMGLGNLTEKREQQAAHGQARLRLIQVRDAVVAQVVQAEEQVRRGRERLLVSQPSLFDREGRPNGPVYQGVRYNFLRVKTQEARPLEVLDAVRSLSDMLDAYTNDMTDFERARFRLLVALGLPTQALLDPHLMPPPPPCGKNNSPQMNTDEHR
jgi:outer membrane protein TolC